MAKVSGLGGYLVIAGSPNAVQHNAMYEYEDEGEADDVTDSSSTGYRQGLPIIKKFQAGQIVIFEDDAAYPEALGIAANAVLDVWFKRGAKSLYDKVTGTIVRSVRVENDQTKARKLTIALEYGALTKNAVAPS